MASEAFTRGWSASVSGEPLIRDFVGPDHAEQWRAWTAPGAEGERWWAVRTVAPGEHPNADDIHPGPLECTAEFPCVTCVDAARRTLRRFEDRLDASRQGRLL